MPANLSLKLLPAISLALIAASCGSGTSEDPDNSAVVQADDCIVQLHGKGGDGAPPTVSKGVATLSPTGNGAGWGARQWTYFPGAKYDEAVDVVAEALDDAACTTAVVHGFSNGGSFAGKLYCNAESFGGRLVGVVIDDPVADEGTVDCQPDETVQAVLYSTGALDESALPGSDCEPIDWTCEGGVVIGIEAYAANTGLSITKSPFSEHTPNFETPEPLAWLVEASSSDT